MPRLSISHIQQSLRRYNHIRIELYQEKKLKIAAKKDHRTSCNAGASFVPSPVTATTFPLCFNAFTNFSLSVGDDLAITCSIRVGRLMPEA